MVGSKKSVTGAPSGNKPPLTVKTGKTGAPVCGEAKIPTDPLEINRLAEAELSRLLRQFRILENDRVAFGEESNPKLKLERQLIDCLQEEKNNLETDLKVAQSLRNRKRDIRVTKELSDLLAEQEKLNEDIKNEKAHVDEMDYQIKKINTQIRECTAKTITDRQLEERIQSSMRTVEKLENQLDVAIKKFNSVLADNDKIREEIDHLIKERAHFNSLWNKMIINLGKGKKFMMDLVEQATMAYDQRDEWCGKLEALKERGKADLLQHTQEMRELQRNLDHDDKLKEYLSIKGQKRIMHDLNQHEEEKRQARREEMEKHLHEYQQIFDEIKEFAHEDNIERLASQFIKQEEENFALFKYVNELNFELETLNDSVDDYRKKIDVQRELNEQRATTQKMRMIQLSEELEKAKKYVRDAEEHLGNIQEKLDKTLREIHKIFQLVKADNSPILELLGDNAKVNIFNVRLYLEILEKRTNELIQVSYYKDKMPPMDIGLPPTAKARRIRKPEIIQLINEPCGHRCKTTNIDRIILKQPCPLCVEREVVSDVIESLQIPDNREEVQERLRIRLGLPDAEDRLHNVSACKLPASRVLLQKRYA